MSDKVILKKEHTETRDAITGEVTERSITHTVKVEQEPSFIKLYIKDMCKLNDVPKNANKILIALLEYVNYNNEIILSAGLKKRIAKELEITPPSLNNGISRLVKSELICSVERGIYLLNPNMFGKGKWKDIKELQITWDYSNKGRVLEEVKTSVTSQPSLPFNNEDEVDYIDANVEEKEKSSFIQMDESDDIENPVDQLSDKDYIAMLEKQLMDQAEEDAKDMSANGYKAIRKKRN